MTTDAAREAALQAAYAVCILPFEGSSEEMQHQAKASAFDYMRGFEDGAEWRATHPLPVSDEDARCASAEFARQVYAACASDPAAKVAILASPVEDWLNDRDYMHEPMRAALQAVAKRRAG